MHAATADHAVAVARLPIVWAGAMEDAAYQCRDLAVEAGVGVGVDGRTPEIVAEATAGVGV